MAPVGILIVLGCAVSFATLDVCRKKLAALYSPFRILTVIMGLQIPLYVAWYYFNPGPPLLSGYWGWGLADIFFNFTANVLIVLGLALSPLSNAAPLLALTPTFSLLFQPFFNYSVSPTQMVGGLVIFGGALILNGLPRYKTEKDRGLLFMMVAALACGFSILFDKQSLHYASIPFHGVVQSTGMTLLGLIAERTLRGRLLGTPAEELELSIGGLKHRGFWIGATLAAFLAGVGQLLSLGYFDPGVVEAVKRALVLFFSVSFGYLFFREAFTFRKILGVFFMVLGIVLTSA